MCYTIPHKNHHEIEWTCVDSSFLKVVFKKPPRGIPDLLDVVACLYGKKPQLNLLTQQLINIKKVPKFIKILLTFHPSIQKITMESKTHRVENRKSSSKPSILGGNHPFIFQGFPWKPRKKKKKKKHQTGSKIYWITFNLPDLPPEFQPSPLSPQHLRTLQLLFCRLLAPCQLDLALLLQLLPCHCGPVGLAAAKLGCPDGSLDQWLGSMGYLTCLLIGYIECSSKLGSVVSKWIVTYLYIEELGSMVSKWVVTYLLMFDLLEYNPLILTFY